MIKIIKKQIKKIIEYILYGSETYNNDVVISGRVQGLKNVEFEGKNGLLDGCNFSGNIKLGYATTLGYNNVLHGNIHIGKYCQLGYNISLISSNHPTSYMTTYINKNLFNGELKKLKTLKSIKIGHDVWIGHNAIILGGVTVGNGAIIGAGSVVTTDVPAYSIVAGVPSKVIKMRFKDTIINQIEELKWWDKSKEELEEIKPLFFKDFSKLNDLYEGENQCTP